MDYNHEAAVALPSAGAKDNDGLRTALAKRTAYVLAAASETSALNLAGLDVLALALEGAIFTYDDSDTTSIQDGITVLRTADGKVFKNAGVVRVDRVLDRIATPAGSPSLDDAYLVTSGATGDFAAQDDAIAVYTQWGWRFASPVAGDGVWVADEASYYHYSEAGAWVIGLGGVLTAASIYPIHFADAPYIRVINQTTSTPPGSPANGDGYIPKATATGSWAGHEGKIAQYRGGGWDILTPAEGWQIYDLAEGSAYTYKSGVWASNALAAGLLASHTVFTLDDPLDVNDTNYTPSDTAPTTSAGVPLLSSGGSLVIAHTGQKIGNRLRITIDASAENEAGGVNNLTLGLFIDAGVSASDWRSKYFAASSYDNLSVSFLVTLTDLDEHSYKLRAFDTGGNFELKRGRVTVEEIRQ